jgi:DNA helicase-2/ATP-dependent DNA helicase PcrA
VKKELIKLPHTILRTKPTADENDEEERRLFYVALTRAKKNIFITYANSYGETESMALTVPSKFISELPANHVSIISMKKYEDEYDERLKLTFAKKRWEPSEALGHFLEKIIHDFKLSPTALNNYLECPQRFFYDNILRVPKTKDFTQSYGTAVHKALELLFKKYKRDYKIPLKKEFLEDFIDALKDEIFTKEEGERAIKYGEEILSKYYDFYSVNWLKRGIPLSCEYDFSRHDVHFNDIPVTGKIDRIDLIDKNANRVRIIDYKTSSPKSLNFILGNTKEKDTKLMYQAYFYKLLSEADPLFQWKVDEIEFDFISPDKTAGSDRKFRKILLPIDEKQYLEFKKTVENTYDKIVNLEFHLEEQACKKGGGTCAYFNICHSNSNE